MVEHNDLIAYSIADDLRYMGFDQVEILGNADEARAFLEQTSPASGLLDVNLRQGATSMPVARKLMAMGVPFAFSSGYGADIGVGNEFQNVPVLYQAC